MGYHSSCFHVTPKNAPQSIGQLWTSDGLVAETFSRHTKQPQQTNMHNTSGIRTHNLNRWSTVDVRFRLRGHRDWLIAYREALNFSNAEIKNWYASHGTLVQSILLCTVLLETKAFTKYPAQLLPMHAMYNTGDLKSNLALTPGRILTSFHFV
jgi:hypothetical protein